MPRGSLAPPEVEPEGHQELRPSVNLSGFEKVFSRTEEDDVEREALPQQHHHRLSVPEVVDVGHEVGDALDREAVEDGRDPQVRVPPAPPQRCAATHIHEGCNPPWHRGAEEPQI